MVKAVLKNGAIVPLEPVPPEWSEGTPLEIERANGAFLDIDAWKKMMDQLCQDSSAEEETLMQAAIENHRREAKAQAQREMGLAP